MRTMRYRMSRIVVSALVTASLLVGCSAESEADALARDLCDLISPFAGLDEDDFEAFMEIMVELEEREDEFLALENRFIESDVSDDELEAAMRARCPEAFDAFYGF